MMHWNKYTIKSFRSIDKMLQDMPESTLQAWLRRAEISILDMASQHSSSDRIRKLCSDKLKEW